MKKTRPKKRMSGRPRGGASLACPRCGVPSRVTLTRRDPESGLIRRWRYCPACRHEFTSEELVAA